MKWISGSGGDRDWAHYYSCNECTSIGTEFYFIDGWNASGVTSGDISVQFPSLVHLPVASDEVATYDYASRLYNVELNAGRRTSEWFTLLAGFRWIELSEEFSTAFTTGGNTSSYLIDVDNQLWGFQVGAAVNFRNNGWGLDALGKGRRLCQLGRPRDVRRPRRPGRRSRQRRRRGRGYGLRRRYGGSP